MKHFMYVIIILTTIKASTQNTLGTIMSHNNMFDGYTLFAPLTSTETYLINNCGEVVHQWTSTFTPGASVYLLENGNLVRTGKITNTNITLGGVGGHIQIFDWDNVLLWEYRYSSSQFTQHHDVFPLPNGNILMLAVTTMTEAEAILLGRDASFISEGKIYNEQIIELEPDLTNGGANIVWEWNIKDHLIQEFDNTKNNYGVVKDHPELLDFNYHNGGIGEANWLHFNSMQYNANLDQIILSSRHLSEIYIIDHSTSTFQATSHSGGIYGKGGDFLYRWGNPEAYDMGDSNTRTLFSQHYPHWIPDGLIDAGKLLIFNNGNSIRFSAINIISPPTISPGVYSYDSVNGFGPTTAEWTYTATSPQDFFSSILSSAQRLPNGNTLICDGDSGYFFEIDSSNNIVWEYINPDSTNGILTQGDSPSANVVFRALKFPLDYAAFLGKDLTPSNPIELMPDLSNCSLLSVETIKFSDLKVYPNPTNNILNIKTTNFIDKIEVYSVLGKLVLANKNFDEIDLSNLSKGLFILKIYSKNSVVSKKIIRD